MTRPAVEAAQEYTELAIESLAKMTADASASAARVSAAVALLNRGWDRSSVTERAADDMGTLPDDQFGRGIDRRIAEAAASGRLRGTSTARGGAPIRDQARPDGVD